MNVNAILMKDDDKSMEFFLRDALLSIGRAWACIDSTQPETLALFDELTTEAVARGTNIFEVALERDLLLTTPLAALCVGNALYSWKQAGENFALFRQWLLSMWQNDDTAAARLLDQIIDVLTAIAILERESPPSQSHLTQIKQSLTQAAEELEEAEKFEEALACAMSAINFARLLSETEAEAGCRFALELAKQSRNQAAIAMLLSQRAIFLARIVKNDPARKLDAFDAFEAALGHTPSDQAQKESMLKLLKFWIHEEDYLQVLKPMLWLVGDDKSLSDSVHQPGVAAAVNTIWKGSLPEWVKHIHYVQGLAIATANARSALTPEGEASIRTLWNTWSIQHNRLRRAIPHGSSIKREEFLHDILLEISHEVTHVFSMFGFVGITLTAMRWALVEMELDVWGRIFYRAGAEFPDPFRITIAPLEDADLLSLGWAEREVELERKIQLVENTWAPWFEGLAVFGELTADPELDKEWQSPVASVVNNLWDRSLASQAEEQKISLAEMHERDRAEADALIAAAIRSRGEFRLRTYVTRAREKYLAGYLAVRSVVAQWRKTLDKPLRGDQAFRILLHMTRFGDYAAIPDLSLSVDDFEKQIVARHIAWVRSMAAVSREDLERMIENDQSPRERRKAARWIDGKLKVSEQEEEDEFSWDFITKLAAQCLSSLIGDRAPAERVPGADELCRTVMAAVANGLTGKKQGARLLSPEIAPAVFSRLVVLPLATSVSTFWLCEEDRTLVCLIRSLEQDKETRSPGYDLLICPLEEEEFLALLAKVQLGGPRRMTATRVIDLMDGYEDRYVGANFIVFQYEDWVYIQPRGILFGLQKVNESLRDGIVERLSPDTLIRDQEELTAENHPCVQRTVSWLERNDWTETDTGNDFTVDIDPWAQRVLRVGKQVLSDNLADVENTSRSLLQFVFGDSELAQTIQTQGFDALSKADPPRLQEFINLLLKTATTPVDNTQYASLNEALTSIMGPLFAETSTGLDFVHPNEFR